MHIFYLSIADVTLSYEPKFVGAIFIEAYNKQDAIDRIYHLLPTSIDIDVAIFIVPEDNSEKATDLTAKVPFGVLLSLDDMTKLGVELVKRHIDPHSD